MRVLALDLGERRIGVALSDPSGTLARPLTTLEHTTQAEDVAAIVALVAEHQVEMVLVGIPFTLRGEVGPQARRVERFTQALAAALPVPVQMWDERYTTLAAEEIMRQSGKGRRRGGPGVDAVAAAIILQEFLDSTGGVKE
jgi:putative Holliday junction resolvase